MEPPRGILASLWNFVCFFPYFIGLLSLGFIKGIILLPLICLVVAIGNSAIIIGLWPVHFFWTLYCILSAKQLGPVLKFVICLFLPVPLILWPPVGICGSIIGGAAYGFLAPMFATFQAVGAGKTNEFIHCIYDGIRDTVKGSCTVVRDFCDVCFHSYFSIMKELRRGQEGNLYEIRLLYLPGAIVAAILGLLVDVPVISIVALFKGPYMLFKGWHRLFHDCIGREGPFLETICVPFAGLAILLWPLAVVGAVLGSIVASIFLGAYAAVVVYQESSFWFGICYIVAALSIYDEYSNDVLDMPEGSCLPSPQFRKDAAGSRVSSRTTSLSRHDWSQNRVPSMKPPMVELRPLELFDSLFNECQHRGEIMVSEGLIMVKDIEDARATTNRDTVISIGLPAYCLLQALLRSAKANSAGILLDLGDNVTEITSTNRPKDTFFDWFFNPLLTMKDQIKAANLSEAEEEYLGRLVLLNGDPQRLKNSDIGTPPESELKRAELDALARRLQGIMRGISRYPTYRRRFESSMKMLSEELAKRDSHIKSVNGSRTIARSKSMLSRIFSQKSFKSRTTNQSPDQHGQSVLDRDIEIQ